MEIKNKRYMGKKGAIEFKIDLIVWKLYNHLSHEPIFSV